jgi:hypothetical protein
MLQHCRIKNRTQNRNALIHKRLLLAIDAERKPHAVLLATDLLFLKQGLLNAA